MQSIQAGIVVDVPDLAASNKKSAIRVLHVDDDSSLLEISKQIMMDMDASLEFDSVNSFDEAFKKLSIGQYDVVISDYEMPQKNGLQFLKELREQKNQIPFILFTGKGREEVAVKALNLGADRYIDKNGSPEAVYCELADAINKMVERKKAKSLLVESEAKYRVLVEESLQGIMVAQGFPPRIVFANSAMTKMLGYVVEELIRFRPKKCWGWFILKIENSSLTVSETVWWANKENQVLTFERYEKTGQLFGCRHLQIVFNSTGNQLCKLCFWILMNARKPTKP